MADALADRPGCWPSRPPSGHWQSLWSNNPQERLNRELAVGCPASSGSIFPIRLSRRLVGAVWPSAPRCPPVPHNAAGNEALPEPNMQS